MKESGYAWREDLWKWPLVKYKKSVKKDMILCRREDLWIQGSANSKNLNIDYMDNPGTSYTKIYLRLCFPENYTSKCSFYSIPKHLLVKKNGVFKILSLYFSPNFPRLVAEVAETCFLFN